MANTAHLRQLKKGVISWNRWRRRSPRIRPDLRDAELAGKRLCRYNFSGARLDQADLSGCDLGGADLTFAYLNRASLAAAHMRRAILSEADLSEASLLGADLRRANLRSAVLLSADFTNACLDDVDLRMANLADAKLNSASFFRADLSGASLRQASVVDTNLEAAALNGCAVYGLSVWNARLSRSAQADLLITAPWETAITADNLEIAQFLHLLLRSEKIRHAVDELASKLVLILGRFTEPRKAVLELVRESIRRMNLLPVLVDFEMPQNRDLTETVSTLAHIARFIIADLTEARSVPQELSHIVPFLPSVPVQPLISSEDDTEYGMFEHSEDIRGCSLYSGIAVQMNFSAGRCPGGC